MLILPNNRASTTEYQSVFWGQGWTVHEMVKTWYEIVFRDQGNHDSFHNWVKLMAKFGLKMASIMLTSYMIPNLSPSFMG